MNKNMRVRLTTGDGRQVDYPPGYGFKTPGEMPCLRCGVCCTKWQAPINSGEAAAIAQRMGIDYATFFETYLQRYPLKDDYYLIRPEDGACAFLRFENGLAGCAIHDFKPEACRNWLAGPEKKECREGLRKRGQAGGLARPSDLLSQDQLDRLCDAMGMDDRESRSQ
ncbi:MAG: YkgJ family cysteine cluster protein [Chloroflexi bacterium]|nr:YkgJ family cysteine cluster protein [Chloroflexota bacterium]